MAQLGKSKTVIFDMDGVIVDSELHWEKLEPQYLSSTIPDWNSTTYDQLTGLNLSDVYSFLFTNYDEVPNQVEFRAAYEAMADIIYGELISLLPDVKVVIESLHTNGVTLGIASSSPRRWIDIVLKRFGLQTYFSSVLSSSDIGGKGKPSPDIYLASAKALKTDIEDCIVIEDSRNGVLAAKSAGMYCYGLRNGFNTSQDLSEADEVITGFASLLR